ncbi:hypothetical protein D9M70_527020 [compost metagenome]
MRRGWELESGIQVFANSYNDNPLAFLSDAIVMGIDLSPVNVIAVLASGREFAELVLEEVAVGTAPKA